MINPKNFRPGFLILAISIVTSSMGWAQIPRERVSTGMEPVELFQTQNLAAQSTVETLPAGNLNVTIMHTFGIVTDKPLNNFFGFDFGPNVRLGLDYGVTDRWTLGVGRSSREKVVDFRTKLALLRQTDSGSVPLSVTAKGDLGITTVENGYDLVERLNFLGSLPIARAFSEDFTLQLTPMFAHFNTVVDPEPHDHFALGIGGKYDLSRRYSFFFETYPMLSEKTSGTKNAYTFGLNINTGGHVFQLFLASAPWHTEQYVLHLNEDDFWAGDFRFGFNVNRVFGLGGH